MQISLVIPYYHSDDEKPAVLSGAVASMAPYFDELIVVADRIDNLATKINRGVSMATNPYIVVTNDDVTLVKGTLKQLCEYNRVMTPTINGGTAKTFHGHAWGMPSWVWNKVGGMDERFFLYYMDVDFAMRLREHNIECIQTPEVDMKHPDGARTLKHWAGKTEQDDRQVFIDKWGEEVYDPFRAQ